MSTDTYWTAGYTVAGASDVIVNRYCRTQKEAEVAAAHGAIDDKERIIELGLSVKVTEWAERWTSTTTIKRDERVVTGTFEPRRRTEQVER